MSRTGASPIVIPDGVDVQIAEQCITVKGKLGQLETKIAKTVSAEIKDGVIRLSLKKDTRETRPYWGTSRANVNNIVQGVSKGFSKTLELKGVGYRAQMKGSTLELQLGFSHPIDFPIPEGIKIIVDKQTTLTISGINKQLVGQVASRIRSYRPPEPYKGKGVHYQGEEIERKEGKKK